jgi:hypothetical protein
MKDSAQWADDGLYSPGQYKSFENMTVRTTGKIQINNKFTPTTVVPMVCISLYNTLQFLYH